MPRNLLAENQLWLSPTHYAQTGAGELSLGPSGYPITVPAETEKRGWGPGRKKRKKKKEGTQEKLGFFKKTKTKTKTKKKKKNTLH